jgi:hypothetical protein
VRNVREAGNALPTEVSELCGDLGCLPAPREALVERQDETLWPSICDIDELITKEKLRRPLAVVAVESDTCIRIKKDAAILSTWR